MDERLKPGDHFSGAGDPCCTVLYTTSGSLTAVYAWYSEGHTTRQWYDSAALLNTSRYRYEGNVADAVEGFLKALTDAAGYYRALGYAKTLKAEGAMIDYRNLKAGDVCTVLGWKGRCISTGYFHRWNAERFDWNDIWDESASASVLAVSGNVADAVEGFLKALTDAVGYCRALGYAKTLKAAMWRQLEQDAASALTLPLGRVVYVEPYHKEDVDPKIMDGLMSATVGLDPGNAETTTWHVAEVQPPTAQERFAEFRAALERVTRPLTKLKVTCDLVEGPAILFELRGLGERNTVCAEIRHVDWDDLDGWVNRRVRVLCGAVGWKALL